MSKPCYYLTSFTSRERPRLNTLHMTAYQGWYERLADDSKVYSLNVRTSPLWLPIASMVTTPELGERLKSVSTAATTPAHVRLAFDWDMHDLKPLAQYARTFHGHTARSGDLAVERFMRNQRRIVEPPDVVEVQPVSAYRVREQYQDISEIEVSAPDLIARDILLSRSMVEEHGIVRSQDFLFTPRAYDIVRPYVEENPWFLVVQL